MISEKTKSLFLKKIHISSDGCWHWTAGLFKKLGYGKFNLNGTTSYAHRVMFMMIKGEIPKGYDICHTCDNRLWINPEHLFLGTRADNMKDARNKGRLRQQKTTACPKGHKYDSINTVINSRGARECGACIKIRKASIKTKQYRKEYYVKFNK